MSEKEWPETRAILDGAIEAWGEDAQVDMAIEEMGELQTALMQYYRDRADEVDVAEEIADVQIILDQLAVMFGDELVVEFERKKLLRLRDRVEAAGGGDSA
jgi:NTP pyrophosphatase (non-canonical NTP hydrolase)